MPVKKADSGFHKGRVTVTELVDSALADYERRDRRSLQDAKERWKLHLEPYFGGTSATRVTTERLEEYAAARIAEKAAKATVNREFALLRFAYNLGRKHRKIQFVPVSDVR